MRYAPEMLNSVNNIHHSIGTFPILAQAFRYGVFASRLRFSVIFTMSLSIFLIEYFYISSAFILIHASLHS